MRLCERHLIYKLFKKLMMKNISHNNNNKGIIGTIAFHLAIALLLIFIGFSPPLPTFPDPEGIIINFGTDIQGAGIVEPQDIQSEPQATEVSVTEVEALTQDFQEAPAIEEKKTQETIIKEEKVVEEVEEPRKVNPFALYKGNDSNDSEGITSGDGNQGSEDGSKDSKNYYGNGLGNKGIGYSLKGRAPIGKFPEPAYPPGNISGKVVVNIKVDKYGRVIAVSEGKGSTTSNTSLIRAAKKAAWKARFNEDFNSIEQTGTITYHFQLQM